MKSVSSLLVFGIILLLLPLGIARAQTQTEFDALKTEVAELRKQIASFRKDLAFAKAFVAPPRKTNLEVRFEAASTVPVAADQQAAFETLAIEAAKLGDLKYTKNCIERLMNESLKQATMYKASLLLARAGLEKDGLEMAKSLANSGWRNKALLKIARGELDD